MATFKCLISGNTVEFTEAHDIKAMQKHPQYEEVVETPKEVKKPKKEVEITEE
jgi:hypothetical protein